MPQVTTINGVWPTVTPNNLHNTFKLMFTLVFVRVLMLMLMYADASPITKIQLSQSRPRLHAS